MPRKEAREDRLEITITKWGRKVIIQSRKAHSPIKLSGQYKATLEFKDDELRGPRQGKPSQRKVP